MKPIFTFVIVFVALFTFGQNNQELKIKLELAEEINENEIPPFCGTMAFLTVFEFNVTKIIKGSYDKSKIYVCIPCARDLYLAGKLKFGKNYTFRLLKPETEEESCDTEFAPQGFTIFNIAE